MMGCNVAQASVPSRHGVGEGVRHINQLPLHLEDGWRHSEGPELLGQAAQLLQITAVPGTHEVGLGDEAVRVGGPDQPRQAVQG